MSPPPLKIPTITTALINFITIVADIIYNILNALLYTSSEILKKESMVVVVRASVIPVKTPEITESFKKRLL